MSNLKLDDESKDDKKKMNQKGSNKHEEDKLPDDPNIKEADFYMPK